MKQTFVCFILFTHLLRACELTVLCQLCCVVLYSEFTSMNYNYHLAGLAAESRPLQAKCSASVSYFYF